MIFPIKISFLRRCLGDERANDIAREIRTRREDQRVQLNTRDLLKEDVEKILEKAETENTALHSRLGSWKRLMSNPEGKKITNLFLLEDALIEYFRNAPNHAAFMEESDRRMLPYACTNVQWHKAQRHRDGTVSPAYVQATFTGFRDGSTTAFSRSWYAGSCDGRTVDEIFKQTEAFRETPEQWAVYEKHLAMWHEVYELTGNQFLAKGLAYPTRGSDDYGYSGRRHRRSSTGFTFTRDGNASRVVIDNYGDKGKPEEQDEEDGEKGTMKSVFWLTAEDIKARRDAQKKRAAREEEEEDVAAIEDLEKPDDDGEENDGIIVLPIHPYVQVFDFESHSYVDCHVACLKKYEFKVGLEKKLILPSDVKDLINTLIGSAKKMMEDIVAGKTGGTIVIATGYPGTGKTLTAEIYAEQVQRPLYTVQCSQLGLSVDDVERTLLVVLKRAVRWNAILLIDEADVYVRTRGEDIVQNAIVGVFLRLLERFQGVLFMTSNRATEIDDAILSRAIAHIRYNLPSKEDLALIWEVLTENYELNLFPKDIQQLVEAFPHISGRNVKTLIKLATSINRKEEYDKGEVVALIKKVAPFVDFPKKDDK